MGKHKSRTAINRKVNTLLSKFGCECMWWNDAFPECMLPWSHSKQNGCCGNPFICKKLYHKYLTSIEKPSLNIMEEFNRRQQIK